MSAETFEQLVQRVSSLRAARDRAKARLEVAEKQLSEEFGITDTEEADALEAKLVQKIDRLQKDLERDMARLASMVSKMEGGAA